MDKSTAEAFWVLLMIGVLVAFGGVLGVVYAEHYPANHTKQHAVCDYFGGDWHKDVCTKDGKVVNVKR